MRTLVLWATREDHPLEALITETTSQAHLEDAKKWALANGFYNLRVLVVDGFEKPDFIGAINKG